MRKLLVSLAAALSLAPAAQATVLESVASGEAATREAALASALRHAVEQIVGMTVDSSTQVQNLKQLKDLVFTRSTGYIENYEVVDEERLPGGYRLTIRARVSKEKLNAAVAPIVGAGLAFDGQTALANMMVEERTQADVRLLVLNMFQELPTKFFFRTSIKIAPMPAVMFSMEQPEYQKKVLINFSQTEAEFDRGWYDRYRRFHSELLREPYGTNLLRNLDVSWVDSFCPEIELVDHSGKAIDRIEPMSYSNKDFSFVRTQVITLLTSPRELPVIPPTYQLEVPVHRTYRELLDRTSQVVMRMRLIP